MDESDLPLKMIQAGGSAAVWLRGARGVTFLFAAFLLLFRGSVLAGKNFNDALIVHTAPYNFCFNERCDEGHEDPDTCEEAKTQINNDESLRR
jgi:hypothetical protein